MWIWTEIRAAQYWTGRNPLVTAFSLSIAVHLTLFGAYRMGERLGWWKHQATWLLNLGKKQKRAASELAKLLQQRMAVQARQEIPLTFVEVDPALSVPEPPKDAKYYGAHSAKAANPDPVMESTIPKIDGRQEKIVRTEDVPKPGPQPLQPSLPPEPKEVPKPKEDRKEGIAEMGTGQPVHERPRTLAKAREQRNMLAGQKMKQDGGVQRRGHLSLDVVGSPFGAYDAAIIAAIQQRWYDLIDSTQFPQRSGKVVLEFRLSYDGRVTDMVMKDNEVGELLALLCQRAIMDPSPFGKWPDDMRRMVGKNYREVLFTFYYE